MAPTVYRSCPELQQDVNMVNLIVLYALRMRNDKMRGVDATMQTCIKEDVVTHTEERTTTTQAELTHSTLDLGTKLKLNVEATDPGTEAMMKIASLVPFRLMYVTLAVACFFCGGTFLQAMVTVFTASAASSQLRSLGDVKDAMRKVFEQLGTRTPYTTSTRQ